MESHYFTVCKYKILGHFMDPATISCDFLMEKVKRSAFSPFSSLFLFIPFGLHLHFFSEVVLFPEEESVCHRVKLQCEL